MPFRNHYYPEEPLVYLETTLNLIGELPSDIEESSGLVVQSPTSYWTHNDHGDKAILYPVDDTRSKLKEFEIDNSENKDWGISQVMI